MPVKTTRQSQHPQADVARLIAGHNPPAWLLKWLQGCAAGLAGAIRDETQYPSRPKQRKRLAVAAKMARHLQRELTDPTMLALLDPAESLLDSADANLTMTVLRNIATNAVRASPKVPKGRGPHKGFLRPEGLAAQRICALVVSVVWVPVIVTIRHEWPKGKDATGPFATISETAKVTF
jgi:hypothetical protein